MAKQPMNAVVGVRCAIIIAVVDKRILRCRKQLGWIECSKLSGAGWHGEMSCNKYLPAYRADVFTERILGVRSYDYDYSSSMALWLALRFELCAYFAFVFGFRLLLSYFVVVLEKNESDGISKV